MLLGGLLSRDKIIVGHKDFLQNQHHPVGVYPPFNWLWRRSLKRKFPCQNNTRYRAVEDQGMKCGEQSDDCIYMSPLLAYSGFYLQQYRISLPSESYYNAPIKESGGKLASSRSFKLPRGLS